MKHHLRRIAAAVLVAAALAGLTACGTPGTGIVSGPMVGIVYANHAYGPTVDDAAFLAILDQAVDYGTYVVVYSSESKPQELFAGEVKYDQSPQKIDDARAAALQEIVDAVVDHPATSPETDPLEASLLIADKFLGREGEREIILLDNMLQTSGAIRLPDGSLDAEPSEVTEFLAESGYVVDQFDGYRIVLAALGRVTPGVEQSTLDSVSLSKLSSLWTAVYTGGGASVVRAEVDLVDVTGTRPPVTVVPLKPIESQPVGCRLALGAGQIAFVQDSGTFLDRAAASATIADAAASLIAAGCAGHVTAVATTSSANTEADRTRVAQQRLDSVVPLLAAALDVDPASIEAVPVGYDPRYCAPDRDEDGRLVLALAAACRQVIIGVGVLL